MKNSKMKKLFIVALMALAGLQANAQTQTISVDKAVFKQGDDMSWANLDVDDSSWSSIDVKTQWDKQGFPAHNNNYAWYRFRINIPKSLILNADQQNAVIINIPRADDVDECYLNGKLIGGTGFMPTSKNGFVGAVNVDRYYVADAKDIHWDKENVVAVRVYNRGGSGGLFYNPLNIYAPKAAEGISMRLTDYNEGKQYYTIEIINDYATSTNGKLEVVMTDRETGAVVKTINKKITVKRGKPTMVTVPYTMDKMQKLTVTYTDAKTGKVIKDEKQLKYVLTPDDPVTPRFNNAPVFGVRPGSPIIYRFAVSGERPMKLTCSNLPEGVQVTEEGVMTGKLDKDGDYAFTVTAENAKGKDTQIFTIKVGADKIGQTPPMGWNSWNCWGLSVSQEKVIASAQALIDKGLADHGYCYINIDDGWEAAERNPDGTIEANEKFPSMKGLIDWLHDRGLKFGIYSGPGATTCGGYLGSLGYEKEDAEKYNEWGVDYLKYDWCSYENVRRETNDWGFASCIRPYLLMQQYIRQQPRDIFYSLGPLGGTQVYLWGLYCDGDSWRTAPDIEDDWATVYRVGFRLQEGLSKYSSVGHWNDPDMLVVGKVGWGRGDLRETRLTPDEQYTHITLWTLLASNMLIGCDIEHMDDFTVKLLCNNEVNAINQDMLGKQADLTKKDGDIEIWSRPLADGSIAVGVFNVGDVDHEVDLKALIPSDKPAKVIRDVWRQKNLTDEELKCNIPLHGCRYLKVTF